MDAVKFLAEYNRMCNTYDDCVGCPMHDKPFCHPHDMTTNREQRKLVDAVERWSCSHSIVTNGTSDTISRAAAIDVIDRAVTKEAARWSLQELPSAQPEVRPIDYQDCSNAMLKMWMDNVVTDVEYNRIMDKLNVHWGKKDE